MSHSGHFITKCSGCSAIIGQCRCMDPNKTVRYELCSTCKAKLEPCTECHERGYHKMDCSQGRKNQLKLPVFIEVSPQVSVPAHLGEPIKKSKQDPRPWINQCDRTAIEALNFLASNPRRSGGQEEFNAEHLVQIARELEVSIQRQNDLQNTFREMILERIEEIKTGHGSDLFSEPNRHGQPKGYAKYLTTKNWAELDDAELLRQFEFLVMNSYRQR